jgi:glutamate--cysteine ligase catalytic subunit
MGLLSLGTPLPWEEAQKHADHVRFHGIQQFLNIWKRLQTRTKDLLLWGDEVTLVLIDFIG